MCKKILKSIVVSDDKGNTTITIGFYDNYEAYIGPLFIEIPGQQFDKEVLKRVPQLANIARFQNRTVPSGEPCGGLDSVLYAFKNGLSDNLVDLLMLDEVCVKILLSLFKHPVSLLDEGIEEDRKVVKATILHNYHFVSRLYEVLLPIWQQKLDSALEGLKELTETAGTPRTMWSVNPYEEDYIWWRDEQVSYVDMERVLFEQNHLFRLTIDEGEFLVAPDREAAGAAAARLWLNRAENDPEELIVLVGQDVLVQWALGREAGPGTKKVRSFQEWLDKAVFPNPEEEFATYDGEEVRFMISVHLADELGISTHEAVNGWVWVVAYRTR